MVHFAFVAEKLGDSVIALADLKQLFWLAEMYGYTEWIQFDASIVCGLAYYTGIVFEAKFIKHYLPISFSQTLRCSNMFSAGFINMRFKYTCVIFFH